MTTADDAGRRLHAWFARRAWPSTLAGALAVFLAVLAIACVHYRGQTLARGPDQADMLLSFFHEASHAVEEEGLLTAMYTPGVRAGVSNWSNPNYHPLYPFYFNWAGADATVEDTLDRLNFIVYLHLAILGAGAFSLARALGVRAPAAIVVGLVLPWFPAVRSAAAWPHIIAGMAWLPWIFAFQARLHATASDRRSALAAVAGLAVCAALLIYAQPAQNLVFAIFGSVVLWALLAVQAALHRDRDALRRFARSTAWLALAAVLVLAATAGYLLEILRFHAQSIRWLGEYGGYVVGDQLVPVGALRVHALSPEDAPLLAAFEYRKGVGNGYLGATLLIAAAALWSRTAPRSPQTAVARALLACALLAALFCFAFMAPVLHAIPLVGNVRELTWWSCLAVVLLAPLAAAGLQGLRREGGLPPLVRDPWIGSAVIGFALALAATLSAATPDRIEAAILLAAGFGALAWSLRAPASAVRARDLACVAVLVCAVWIPFRHNIEFARRDATVFLPDRVQARADAERLRTRLPDEDTYRIVLAGTLPNAHLLTHAYAALGFRSIHGGIGPANHAKYALLSTPNPAVSALYGVKYVLLPAASASGDVALRPGLALRTNPAALPRLFFVGGGLRVTDDPVAALRALDDPSPVHTFAAPEDLPAGFDPAAFASAAAPTLSIPTLAENRRTRLRTTLVSDRPGLLILNEDPEARWRARIDGKSVAAFRINGFQTAFAIPVAGRHVVEIERPGRLFGAAP